ncbi:hypothetical protein RHGRI_035114 [Rhododendron griersonianum]|uniref:ubiquitinyl hydrolase 1 n=1 Tax=Rhododendron griersonianum TaxID=479676 RepID=A0AAV6I6Q0_9ERIC|nr:hypothetical protein RHGRI_035114 [Rhododendron griersonianum]
MFLNRESNQKAKILRKVDYPVELDVYDLCSDDLRKKLKAPRKILRDEKRKKLHSKINEEKTHWKSTTCPKKMRRALGSSNVNGKSSNATSKEGDWHMAYICMYKAALLVPMKREISPAFCEFSKREVEAVAFQKVTLKLKKVIGRKVTEELGFGAVKRKLVEANNQMIKKREQITRYISQQNVITQHPTIPLPSPADATPPNLHSFFPILQSFLETNIHERGRILSLMKQASACDFTANRAVDGGCTPVNIAPIEKSLLEQLMTGKKSYFMRYITDLRRRLICAQEELQKYKTQNPQV